MARLLAQRSSGLIGHLRVPSDKSMSHRSLLLGAVAEGVTRVDSLLTADDVMHTAQALRAMGVEIETEGDQFLVRGGRLVAPGRHLDLGNAGTGVRLLMGLAAGQQVACTFTGDPSLRRRPMGRVLDPLRLMGLEADDHDGRLPVTLRPVQLKGVGYGLPMASAQVKSALLLAGLGADSLVTVVEKVPTRDHTERMLTAFGADITTDGHEIVLRPGRRLVGQTISVPADPSSAAFPIVAASILEGSDLLLEAVMMNPRRTGLFSVLKRMGARLTEQNSRQIGGEDVADLLVRFAALKGTKVEAHEVPDMIDEIPILSVAAAVASGITRIEGLEELKVKESDRLTATANLLRAAGASCEMGDDWLEIEGSAGKPLKGGALIDTDHDHRMGMAALILGLQSSEAMTIEGAEAVDTSFPGFAPLMRSIGAQITSG
ncbi:MAG: 3-phosphoshikimate 1-carboxyvinyltransferase [Pseudomonadota bacterium]